MADIETPDTSKKYESQGQSQEAQIQHRIEQLHKEEWEPPEKFKTWRNQEWYTTTRQKSAISTSLEEFTVITGGPGLEFYFRFLRDIGYVACFAAILACPIIFFNSVGRPDGFKDDSPTGALFVTTLGNLGDRTDATTGPDRAQPVRIGSKEISRDDIAKTYTSLDIVYSFVFILAVVSLRWIYPKHARRSADSISTPADYAVMVSGLPEDSTEDELKAYFEALKFHVHEVILVRKGIRSLRLASKRNELFYELDQAEAKVRKYKSPKADKQAIELWRKIYKISDKISAVGEPDSGDVIRAFVLFETAEIRKEVRRKPRKSFPRLRDRYRLRIEDAAEPEDVMFENLLLGSWKRFFRNIFTFAAGLFVMTLSFWLIYGAKNLTVKTTGKSSSCSLKSGSTDEQIRAAAELNSSCCSLFGSRVFNEWNTCRSYILDEISRYGLTIASIIGVIAVNYILTLVVHRLADFEGPLRRSDRDASVSIKMMVASFINTALLTVLINSNFQEEAKLATDLLFAGAFRDFSSGWYAGVGTAIIISHMTSGFYPLCMLVAMATVRSVKKWLFDSALTQRSWELLHEGLVFSLPERYGVLLNAIFVALMFCSGMPVMLLSLFGIFFFNFWFEKWAALKVYRKPEAMDVKASIWALRILPVAIIFHLSIAIWMLSNPNIFLTDRVGVDLVKDLLSYDDSTPFNFKTRLSMVTIVPFIVLLAVFALYCLLEPILASIAACTSRNGNINQIAPQDSLALSTVVEEWRAKGMATSYRVQDMVRYNKNMGATTSHGKFPQQAISTRTAENT